MWFLTFAPSVRRSQRLADEVSDRHNRSDAAQTRAVSGSLSFRVDLSCFSEGVRAALSVQNLGAVDKFMAGCSSGQIRALASAAR
jgi:hypothetical protein